MMTDYGLKAETSLNVYVYKECRAWKRVSSERLQGFIVCLVRSPLGRASLRPGFESLISWEIAWLFFFKLKYLAERKGI